MYIPTTITCLKRELNSQGMTYSKINEVILGARERHKKKAKYFQDKQVIKQLQGIYFSKKSI